MELDKRIIVNVLSRDPPSIKSKTEMYAFYNTGFFGNKPLTWNSYEEIINSGWRGAVCMRSKQATDRKVVRYNIPLKELPEEISKWRRENPGIDITFNQSMPDHYISIQGEVMRSPGGLDLLYTTVKKPMNLALQEEELHAEGLKAKILLLENLYPSSFADIESLLEIFPVDAIEFSSYRIPVGNIPGRNTIIWDVRNY